MAKTRLLATHRTILKNFINPRVVAPEEAQAEALALTTLNDDLVVLLDRQFPLKDMNVLYKYRLATVSTYVQVRWDTTRHNAYKGAKLCLARLLPVEFNNTYTGHLILPLTHPVYALIDTWAACLDARRGAVKQKQYMYHDFIDNVRTFEDLIEVWPEAELARPLLNLPATNALVKVSAETLAFIQTDSANRFPPKMEDAS